MWVAGVDGCRAGWLAVLVEAGAPDRGRMQLVTSFEALLVLPEAPCIIAIDMPIGLPERGGPGGRRCDIEARAGLGGRQSAVFAVPSRAAVMAADYPRACAAALASSDPPRKVSKQVFNLFPKIREIDRRMTPQLQQRVRECHPEAAFRAMNGGKALGAPKKVRSQPFAPGLDLRRNLLAAAGFGGDLIDRAPPPGAGADDLLDACACAWSGLRILAGTAQCFPALPPHDARGLRMEIWA